MSVPVNTLRRRALPMASMGSLARVSLAEVLKAIALNELSGSLEVSSGRVVRTLHFDRGFVVFTSSTSEADRLANCLLDAGKITEEDFEAASRLVVEGKRRIGAALVELGLLTGGELEQELGNQARQIAASLFAAGGMYRFHQKPCAVPEELRQSLSIYRIQLEGIRQLRNADLVTGALPDGNCALRLASVPPFSFEDVRFLPEELLVMEAAQKERTIEAIVERVSKPREITLRALYGLLSAGILVLVDESLAAPHVPETTSDIELSTPESADADGAEEAVRLEVLAAYSRSENASPSELLGLGEAADELEVRRAHAGRQSEWEAKLTQLGGDETLLAMVEEIRRRLERARDELVQSSAAGEPESREAPKKAVASFRTAEDKDEVKRLLKEVKLRRMVNDNEGVISFLYKIVEIAPDNPKFEGMLAQALGAHPVLRKKAERHFRKAIALDPGNAELHYHFGRYYQSFDMKSRALAEYKTALRIDPGLSKARSALVELKGRDDSLQDKLKQIFR